MLNENKVASWNFIQGLLYTTLAIFFMIYPQIFDIFLDNLTNADYKLAQVISAMLLLVGHLYIDAGLPNYFSKNFLSRLIDQESISNIKGGAQSYAFGSTSERIIFVPIVAVITILVVDNPVITVVGIFLAVADPMLGIMTLFVLKKYGHEELQSE